jgi:hypothetical protein
MRCTVRRTNICASVPPTEQTALADPNVLDKYLEKDKHKGPVMAARSKL